MRVLVCGGRDFNDYLFLADWLSARFSHLWNFETKELGITIIQGGANGADKLAGKWAAQYNIEQEVYPADWKKYGKRAGYIRNKQMLEEGKPDLVIAFPGGKGTAMMVKLARDVGVPVEEVKYEVSTDRSV